MRTRWIVAALLALVGLTFIGQGIGYIGGSAIGSSFWAIFGVILVVVAGFVAWTAFKARATA